MNIIHWRYGWKLHNGRLWFNEASDISGVSSNKCSITKTKVPIQTPWAAEIQGQRSPLSLLYSQSRLFACSSKNKLIWEPLRSGLRHILFCSSRLFKVLRFETFSVSAITISWYVGLLFHLSNHGGHDLQYNPSVWILSQVLSAEPIFPCKIFKQPSKSWSRDDQAWMCPGWLRASSAVRCPRRAAAITCLPTWRWSRRQPSSSCCCSSSSWPCSSCAVSASCWTPTAACPHPTGQITLRRTRLITASSEVPWGSTNWKKINK